MAVLDFFRAPCAWGLAINVSPVQEKLDLGPRLLADWLARAFTGARIGLGALPVHGEVAAVADTTVAAEVHQALDVHADFAAQIAFEGQLRNLTAQRVELLLGQIANLGGWRDSGGRAQRLRRGRTDPIDVAQGNHHVLVVWYVDTGNTGHIFTPISLKSDASASCLSPARQAPAISFRAARRADT